MAETQNWERRHLETIKPLYPAWDLWVVPNYVGPATWCARPKGAEVSTIRVHSPEELIAALGDAGREASQ